MSGPRSHVHGKVPLGSKEPRGGSDAPRQARAVGDAWMPLSGALRGLDGIPDTPRYDWIERDLLAKGLVPYDYDSLLPAARMIVDPKVGDEVILRGFITLDARRGEDGERGRIVDIDFAAGDSNICVELPAADTRQWCSAFELERVDVVTRLGELGDG